MSKVLVAGLINIETTVKVDGFPIHFTPVRYPFFGVHATISGVGYNVAKALTTLGDEVRFLSLIGQDMAGRMVTEQLATDNMPADYVLSTLDETPRSVIMYDDEGRRQINVDLKDIQETAYPLVHVEGALAGCSVAALCNINFSRPMLALAKAAGIPIATDVHALGNLNDDYNQEYMAAADILFLSDEHLPGAPEDCARQLQARFGTPIIVIGLGAAGALLAIQDENFMARFPAVYTRPVVNTIGAGDALFSAFVHFYGQQLDAQLALRKAIVFASYKIGVAGAADGFLNEDGVEEWLVQVN
jgi:ribokinase